MTYEPDEYMSQPDGNIILEEHIRYVKSNDGMLVKHITTRRFQGGDVLTLLHHPRAHLEQRPPCLQRIWEVVAGNHARWFAVVMAEQS